MEAISRVDNNVKALLELIKAGLWENEAQLTSIDEVDYEDVMRMAEEQSVIGLVAAGIEVAQGKWLKVHGVPLVSQEVVLQFVGQAILIEQRNLGMNSFIEDLYGKMQKHGLYGVLMKGQGIAQCYERPLWRTSGDIDLLLNGENYDKAKEWIDTYGEKGEEELLYKRHITYLVNSWDVELHGTMRGELGESIDKVIDEVQKDVFYGGNVRSWRNGNTTVFLPSADNDVIFVFTHILQHFFRGGIGLRQICDWCRLMWTYRAEFDLRLLESRIRKMGLMSEWKTFGAFAVEYLGMPVEAMPLCYKNDNKKRRLKRKAERILKYVMEVGNFGHNRDLSYKTENPFFVRMMISLKHRTSDFMKQVMVFPLDAVRAYWYIWGTGLKVVFKRATTFEEK